MKIYIDIVYLLNVYLGLLCLLSLGVLLNEHYLFKKVILISFLWGCVVMSLYMKYREILFIMWGVLISFLIDRKHVFKNFILWNFLYFTFSTSFLQLSHNIYLHGPVLIADMSFHWFYALGIGTVIAILYLGTSFYLKRDILKQNLYHSIQIKMENKVYQCRGFMDTGNQASADGLPVIFTAIPFDSDQSVCLYRVGGKQRLKVLKVQLCLHSKWQEVYLAYMEDLMLEDADILLNFEVL